MQETKEVAVLQDLEGEAKAGLGIHKALEKLNMELFFTNDVHEKTSSTGHLVKPRDPFRREGSTSQQHVDNPECQRCVNLLRFPLTLLSQGFLEWLQLPQYQHASMTVVLGRQKFLGL